ncbi:MAG: hypothetical protein LBD50_02930 [Rickettsiales bacterium]|nr:hypothetical protein [Rickettsiales bacterium]
MLASTAVCNAYGAGDSGGDCGESDPECHCGDHGFTPGDNCTINDGLYGTWAECGLTSTCEVVACPTCRCLPYGSASCNCSSDTDGYRNCSTTYGAWSSYDATHERRSYQYYNWGECACKSTYQYACKSGYYGAVSSNPASVCTACPCMTDVGGVSRCGTNTAGSNTALGTCMMGTQYEFNDGIGRYAFESACPAS